MTNKKVTKLLLLILTILVFNGWALAQEDMQPSDPDTFKEKKEKEGYVLNLKELIKKSKKKMEKVNQKLKDQAKDRRNQQREEKAREYYEKATRLYEEGEFDAAKALWEKAIRVTEHEEMSGYVNLSILRQNKEEKALKKAEEKRIKRLEVERGYTVKEVDKKYDDGTENYKKGRYLAAKVDFEEVNLMFPSHRATDSYLGLINANIEEDQRKLIEAKVKEGPVSDSAADKAAWKKELQRQEKERRNHLEEQAQFLYEEAVHLYKNKDLIEAKQKFKEIEWILPDYKKTVKYLISIDKHIKKYGIEYTEEEKEEFQKKKIKELKIADMKYEKKKNEQRKSSFWPFGGKKVTEFDEDKAENLYDDGVAFYKKKYYPQARDKFLEVQEVYPGYKKTDKYLTKIYKALPVDFRQSIPESSKPAYQNVQQKNTSFSTDSSVAKAVEERQLSLSVKVEGKYREAVDFYTKGNFREAKNKFIEVEALSPSYQATRDYLMRIDDDILYDQGRQANMTDLDIQQKVIPPIKSAQAFPNFTNQKEDLYHQALRFYESKQFVQAKHRFTEVNRLHPGYKKTKKYLKKVDKELLKERKKLQKQQKNLGNRMESVAYQKTEEKQYYSSQPEEKYFKGETKAQVKEDRAVETTSADLNPLTVKEQKELERKQEEIKRITRANNADDKKRLKKVLKTTYADGVSLFKEKRFLEAKAKFATIERLYPGYKNAQDYMSRIDGLVGRETPITTKEVKKAESEIRKNRVKEAGKAIYKDPVTSKIGTFKSMVADEQFEMEKKQKEAEEERLREVARKERKQRKAELELQAMREKMELQAIREQQEIEKKRLVKEEERARKKAEKEVKELAKREFKLREKKRKQELKDLKSDIETVYKDGLQLYRKKKIAEAKARFVEFENMLIDPRLSESYRIRMKNRLKKHRLDVQEDIDKEMQEDAHFAYQKDIKTEEDRTKIKIQRKREIEDIQRKIRIEEDRLEREKEYERRRLEKLEKKRASIIKDYKDKIEKHESNDWESDMNSKKYSQNVSKARSNKSIHEQQNDLEELIRIRQKELERERARIRQEFDENVEKLYQRAVRMYKKGLAAESSRMFLEIDSMKPGYKKTGKYLTKLRSEYGNEMTEDPYRYTYNVENQKQGSRKNIIQNTLDKLEENLW